MDCPHVIGAQRLVEHRAASVDVIAQQMGETFGVGGAARPAQ